MFRYLLNLFAFISPAQKLLSVLHLETNEIIDSMLRNPQAYTFTSKPIAQSLIRAKKRGIDVKIILDESQISSKYSVINKLFEEKIPIWIDLKPAIAHNKIVIIDDQKIITGSFNFSDAAQQRNAENHNWRFSTSSSKIGKITV